MMAAIALLAASGVVSATTQTNGDCDLTQFNDNSWVVRDGYTGNTGPWVTSVEGQINRYAYSVCNHGFVAPNLSGTGSWVAIEGPGPEDIVHVGYWVCGDGVVCGNDMHPHQLDFFFAWGASGDPFHAPWPSNISLADGSSTHIFTVTLVYNADGTRTWHFKIDHVDRVLVGDGSWRTWNRSRVEVGNEQWNCGDQIGGRGPDGSDQGNHQKFRGISWIAGGITHVGGLTNPQWLGNNPQYPWVNFQTINGSTSDFDVWTQNHGSTCSSG